MELTLPIISKRFKMPTDPNCVPCQYWRKGDRNKQEDVEKYVLRAFILLHALANVTREIAEQGLNAKGFWQT
jgi:hypothetical protein